MSALIPIREHDGQTSVSGRDLHDFLGLGRDYTNWFKSMAEYGFAEGDDYAVVSDRVGVYAESGVNLGGRPRVDHAMTLDMAKELAMIQRTPRGKEARQYFIEVEKRARAITVPQTYAEALEAAAAQARRAEDLEATNAVLTPRAEAWDELASAEGDYSVADAAKVLSRAGVKTGPQRLFEQLADMKWIYRAHDRRWRVYASSVDAGYLTEKLSPPRRDRMTDELIAVPPQVRVTVRGLERLRVRLGSIETGVAA